MYLEVKMKIMKYIKFFIISVPLAILLYALALLIKFIKDYEWRDKGARE